MLKFVWDTSAIINIKEPNTEGYSPGHSFYKDLAEGIIDKPYLHIFPAIAVFEVNATVSKKHRNKEKILREFYIMDDNSVIYSLDREFILKCSALVSMPGFNLLKGADLIFACIAYIEKAYLVTMDNDYNVLSGTIKILNLNDSMNAPKYRDLFR